MKPLPLTTDESWDTEVLSSHSASKFIPHEVSRNPEFHSLATAAKHVMRERERLGGPFHHREGGQQRRTMEPSCVRHHSHKPAQKEGSPSQGNRKRSQGKNGG